MINFFKKKIGLEVVSEIGEIKTEPPGMVLLETPSAGGG